MTHFVDRQQLHELKSNLRRPIDEFAQHLDVADSQIVVASQAKEWRENPCNLFLRRKLHYKSDE